MNRAQETVAKQAAALRAFRDAVFNSHWTWIAIAIAILGLAIFCVHVAHRRWKRGWLSEIVAQRLSAARKQRPAKQRATPMGWRRRLDATRLTLLETWDRLAIYFSGKFLADLKTPQVPSLASALVCSLAIAAFFVIPRPPSISALSHFHWQDWSQEFIADLDSADGKVADRIIGAFTGLAVVVIALIVFVAESIRDDNDFERKGILVKISWLWPLGLAATLIPFGFLWSAARGLTVLLEVVVALFTLFAFSAVIRSLLDPEKRASDRLTWLRGRLRVMMSDSVRERIGNSVLLEQLGAGKPIDTLQYTIFRTRIEESPQSYLFIEAPEDGWLADIQFDELKKLGDRLDRYARDELGFSLRDSGPNVRAGTISPDVAASPATRLPKREAFLLKRYREEVPADTVFYAKRRSLIALPEAFAQNPPFLADIRAAIPHIFRFAREEPSSVAIRREMQGTKDQLAQAIRDRALGAIDDLRQTYLQIAEEFLTQLVELGGGYSAEQARRERGDYFNSWTEIRWLVSDLRELIGIAVDVGNTDVISPIAFLPFAIAMRAIQARDHLLFQQFYQFAIFLYVTGNEHERTAQTRAWMTEKSWRWPKEISDFYVLRELESESATLGELDQMCDFALYVLRIFQDLLKQMADTRDVDAFVAVSREVRRLYARFRNTIRQPGVAILRLQLDQTENETKKTTLRSEIEREEKRIEIARRLQSWLTKYF